jgi:hypothetical protein
MGRSHAVVPSLAVGGGFSDDEVSETSSAGASIERSSAGTSGAGASVVTDIDMDIDMDIVIDDVAV